MSIEIISTVVKTFKEGLLDSITKDGKLVQRNIIINGEISSTIYGNHSAIIYDLNDNGELRNTIDVSANGDYKLINTYERDECGNIIKYIGYDENGVKRIKEFDIDADSDFLYCMITKTSDGEEDDITTFTKSDNLIYSTTFNKINNSTITNIYDKDNLIKAIDNGEVIYEAKYNDDGDMLYEKSFIDNETFNTEVDEEGRILRCVRTHINGSKDTTEYEYKENDVVIKTTTFNSGNVVKTKIKNGNITYQSTDINGELSETINSINAKGMKIRTVLKTNNVITSESNYIYDENDKLCSEIINEYGEVGKKPMFIKRDNKENK